MNNKTVLFISHKETNCGVHDYGLNVFDSIKKSQKLNFIYCECENVSELDNYVRKNKPVAIIYNYHQATLKWLNAKIIRKFSIPQIGTIHEITQQIADKANNSFFDFYIASDPTLLLRNPLVFKTGRPLPVFENKMQSSERITIGSFGFGTHGKGFDKIILAVQQEFDEAIIRFNIPFAEFGDREGKNAKKIATLCKELITKPKIELQLTHDFFNKHELLEFLSKNTINLFFYEQMENRGISSAIDYALAVNKPIGITFSIMFRHIFSKEISIENNTIKSLIQNGTGYLVKYHNDWSQNNLIWDYERIIHYVLANYKKHSSLYISKFIEYSKIYINKFRYNSFQDKKMGLYEASSAIYEKEIVDIKINTVKETNHNRILDNECRENYKSIIDAMFQIVPELMNRKIPEANIQQAFVLNTVMNFANQISNPKILCIGAYEDTAAIVLQKIGYKIEEIDPILNYDLNTFITKPTTLLNSYDLVFSTSVIEHVFDDELFINQISQLLKKNGIAILTCDFNNNYKKGDKIPSVDYRFYTKFDLQKRLLSKIPDCKLFDIPNWDSLPDFVFENCKYSFASFVIIKNDDK